MFVLIYTALVTQPMLQLRPNQTELRSMDYYHQIFCRFQKPKRKNPPPSLLSNDFEKSWIKSFWPYKDFWSKISCIGMWKWKLESIENFFINKIFKSWFDHFPCSPPNSNLMTPCLLYTSDAADDMQCVDLGGRRIIKKKKKK